MTFALGRPFLLLLGVAVVTAGLIAMRMPQRPADLTVWTFSAEHAAIDGEALTAFGRTHAARVAVQTLADRAENLRLQSIFLDPPGDRSSVPDLVEIEIGQIGRFFRPPTDQIGLMPLNEWLARDGLLKTFDAARLTTWSKNGQVFGLPMDLHPVALAYRADLFADAGVDLEHAETWPAFQEACLAYQRYWQTHGHPSRRAIELSRSAADDLSMMLLQRGENLIEADGRVTINSKISVATLMFYARLAAGAHRVGLDSGGALAEALDISRGDVAVLWMPDWRLATIRKQFPELTGKWRCRPLPRFAPGDATTASWGGTMLGIPRSAPHPQLAWQAAKHLLLDPSAVALRTREGILPAVPTQRTALPLANDSYFGGQEISALYAALAEHMPSPAVHPQAVIARAELSVALSAVITEIDRSDAAAIEPICRRWLDWAAADLRARLAQGQFAS